MNSKVAICSCWDCGPKWIDRWKINCREMQIISMWKPRMMSNWLKWPNCVDFCMLRLSTRNLSQILDLNKLNYIQNRAIKISHCCFVRLSANVKFRNLSVITLPNNSFESIARIVCSTEMPFKCLWSDCCELLSISGKHTHASAFPAYVDWVWQIESLNTRLATENAHRVDEQYKLK